MPDEKERQLIERKCNELKVLDPELYMAYALAYGLDCVAWRSNGPSLVTYGNRRNKLIRIWNLKGVDDSEIDGRGYRQ